MKILILGTGDSCQSRMAHGWLQSFDPHILVSLAGTGAIAPPDEMAVAVMAEAGIDIRDDATGPVQRYLNQPWDYLITVCSEARDACPVFTGKVRHHIHIACEDPALASADANRVQDEYRRIRDQIRKEFYDFYVDTVLDGKGERCRCGAHAYCRCD